MDREASSAATSVPGFDTSPYEPDRRYSAPGLIIGLLVMLGAATGLGYVASIVDEAAPRLEWAWTALTAGILAGLGWLLVGWTSNREPWLAFQVGLLSGLTAFGTMFYGMYSDARDRLEEETPRVLAARLWLQVQAPQMLAELDRRQPVPNKIIDHVQPVIEAQLQAGKIALPKAGQAHVRLPGPHKRDRGDLWDQLERRLQGQLPDLGPEVNRAAAEAVARFGFGDFLAWRAAQGVPVRLFRIRAEVTLTGAWAFVFWIAEGLVAGLAPGLTMYVRARRPFCGECNRWKRERELGFLNLPGARAVQLFTRADFAEFAAEVQAQKEGSIQVKAAVCPNCQTEAPIEVRIIEVSKNAKGSQSSKELAQLTYPGSALSVLEALFAPEPISSAPSSTGSETTHG
jgi:hypothetical protein